MAKYEVEVQGLTGWTTALNGKAHRFGEGKHVVDVPEDADANELMRAARRVIRGADKGKPYGVYVRATNARPSNTFKVLHDVLKTPQVGEAPRPPKPVETDSDYTAPAELDEPDDLDDDEGDEDDGEYNGAIETAPGVYENVTDPPRRKAGRPKKLAA